MEATKSTAAAQTTTKKKKKVSPYMVFSTVVIILLAIAFAFPLYWIITGSFKTPGLHQRYHARVVAQRVGHDQLRQAVQPPESPPVGVCGALQQPLQRRRQGHHLVERPAGARRHPLADQHRVHGRRLDDSDLHHLRHGRLCPGQEALRRPQRPVHPDRLRHGPAQAGHPDPPAA